MNDFAEHERLKIMTAKHDIKSIMHTTFGALPSSVDKNFFFVSGGCIASLLQNEKPKDWDVYCIDNIMLEHVADVLNKNSNLIADYDEKYRNVTTGSGKAITENAITLNNRVQFITRNYGTPDQIRSTFDYVHCTPYYSIGENKLYISRKQFDACVNKKMIVNNEKNVTKHRLHKFLERGYTI